MKLASLFSGIGGFELGFLQADPKTEIVFSSEKDKYAKQIYLKNFGVEPYGDITKINATDIPGHDVLCGGFPCQDVSIAGKRAGLCGARTGLFFEIIRILREKQPMLVFLENVKGLLSSNGGWDFAKILVELESIGYECEWQVLNSKNHGVPQNRERVFIIGHLRGPGTRKIFPIRESNGENFRWTDKRFIDMQLEGAKVTDIARTIQARYYKGYSSRYGENLGVICHSTFPRSSKSGNGGTGPLCKLDEAYCCDAHNNQAIEVHRAPLKFKGRNQKKFDDGDYSFTIDSCNTGGVEITQHRYVFDEEMNEWVDESQKNIRRLTPLECERLQGFPDNWTKGISDTQRYKCLGNAVTVNVIEFLANKIIKMLKEVNK